MLHYAEETRSNGKKKNVKFKSHSTIKKYLEDYEKRTAEPLSFYLEAEAVGPVGTRMTLKPTWLSDQVCARFSVLLASSPKLAL